MTPAETEAGRVLSSFWKTVKNGADPAELVRANAAMNLVIRRIRSEKTVSGALKYLITEVFGYTLAVVSDGVGLSEAAVSRYADGTRTPSFCVTLAICVYLRLPPRVTRAVIQKTRRELVPDDERDAVYTDIVDHAWLAGSVAKANAVLAGKGLPPLVPERGFWDGAEI